MAYACQVRMTLFMLKFAVRFDIFRQVLMLPGVRADVQRVCFLVYMFAERLDKFFGKSL